MSYSPTPSLAADPDYPPTQGALPVWTKVFTKPGEQTFVEITEHPEARAKAAYIWVFLAGTFSGLISSITQFVLGMLELQQVAPDFGQVPGMTGVLGTAGLVGAVCGAPIAGLFSVAGFAISTAIIQATAKFFGGQGSFDRLAYAFGAITVPLTLISALSIPLNAIPFAGLCTLPVLLGLILYALFLEAAAIKAVHRFTWGEATATLLLPTILLTMVCGLMFVLLMRAAGPSINEIFRQLQQIQ